MKDEQSVDEYMAEQEIDEREERESQEPSEGYYDSFLLGEKIWKKLVYNYECSND